YVALWNWDDQAVLGSLEGSRGKAGADGVWRWPHAPQGSLQFLVSLAGYQTVRGAVLTPDEENVVAMSPESAPAAESKTKCAGRLIKISGRVLDFKTQAPIARFRITPGYETTDGGRMIWIQDGQSKGRGGVYRREFGPNDVGPQEHVIALRVEADGYEPTVIE